MFYGMVNLTASYVGGFFLCLVGFFSPLFWAFQLFLIITFDQKQAII